MKAGLVTRLALVEAALNPEDQWWKSEGLSSLLAAAKRLPPRDPWDLPDLEDAGSFGRLLKEARQWQEEHGQ
jgi:hypothetical protein